MFSVSIAVVKWWNNGFDLSRRRSSNNPNMKFCTSSKQWGSPSKSGKESLILIILTFSSRRSVLFKNRIIDTLENVLLLMMVSKMSHDSTNLLVFLSSINTWSNSLDEAKNNIEVIPSKHWNHFCRCDRCPPTSTNRKGIPLMSNWCSMMPFVAFLEWRISNFVGT